jgi:TatD DNase family protein
MIIDSHCHLDFPDLYDNLDSVIKRAEYNRIKYMLSICTTIDSFERIKKIIKKYKNVFGTFGIHPHETQKNQNVDTNYIIKQKKNNIKVIGIGESGLDFYYNYSDKNIQKKSFLNHIYAASELNIPIIIHSRNAESETFDILKSESKNLNLKMLVHCFTGSKDFAKKLININCFISLSGIITFKNSIDLVEAAFNIPLDYLLVETDSPYLAPIPYRGKTNEPSYIIQTVKKLAEIKKTSEEEVIKSTTENFNKLFNIL